jgi:hypothetical protein
LELETKGKIALVEFSIPSIVPASRSRPKSQISSTDEWIDSSSQNDRARTIKGKLGLRRQGKTSDVAVARKKSSVGLLPISTLGESRTALRTDGEASRVWV